MLVDVFCHSDQFVEGLEDLLQRSKVQCVILRDLDDHSGEMYGVGA